MNIQKNLKVPSIPIQLILAVILAIIAALAFKPLPLEYEFSQIGNIFMDGLKMIIVPLAFISITNAVIKLGSQKIQQLSVYFIPLFVSMCLVGFAIGYILMSLLPVTSFEIADTAIMAPKSPTVLEFIRSCIPVNPFKSLVTGNMLQVIVLSFFVGIAALQLKNKDAVVHGFDTAQQICIRMTNIIMHIAPLGVFCLLYPVVSKNLSGVVTAYIQMTAALVIGIIIYMVCCSIPVLYLCKVHKPLVYFKTIILQDIVGAIAGGSVTYMAPRIKNLKENTDLNPDIIDFFIPLTAILTRMGSAICVAIYTVFAASIFNVTLSPEQVIVCAFLTIIALMCAPGIIGGTLMDCAIIWAAVGIPIEAIAYIAGIDYIIDVIRTVLNVQGGEIITACMNHFSISRSSLTKNSL